MRSHEFLTLMGEMTMIRFSFNGGARRMTMRGMGLRRIQREHRWWCRTRRGRSRRWKRDHHRWRSHRGRRWRSHRVRRSSTRRDHRWSNHRWSIHRDHRWSNHQSNRRRIRKRSLTQLDGTELPGGLAGCVRAQCQRFCRGGHRTRERGDRSGMRLRVRGRGRDRRRRTGKPGSGSRP